ncbi:MmgE/PrpD family protein [Nocardia ignorata]|uniref:2-methylcitrate dehydratase PrpD n=1 Tax=Nocardia ignorata TaxID=145285 RepID=A0A4R6PJH8_NOCIG|nr:MmgE/PrpD family protein [Nocardia ignorata]TDP37753.1 2-methylcitrate dehydratase PrpD [Nocardia ignorata]
MADTIVEQLARFTTGANYDTLPPEAVDEAKRLLLDAMGCALGAVEEPKGKIGIQYGKLTGGTDGDATIIGTDDRVSIFGASFANGELINALDFDAVLPPGHVSPYVLPTTMAMAESRGRSGREVLAAVALSHEMSYRFYKSMDYLRDVQNDSMDLSPVIGYSVTVFGGTAAAGKLAGQSTETLANALGIAAATAPVNSMRPWIKHAPSSTLKYLLAGTLTQASLTAVFMAELGHTGDLEILDDAEVGFRKYIGTRRWEPQNLTDALGTEWRFLAEQSYKPYPHCRILHAPLHALTEILETNDIRPEEIDAIRCWGEAAVMHPLWQSRVIEKTHDAQFDIAHGLSVGAHRVTPSRAWHAPELVFSDSVLGLMDKVTFAPHPDYFKALSAHPSARPTKVEVDARGTTFVAERTYPKGSPSPDPSTRMTTDELVAKFRINARDVLSENRIDQVVETVLGVDKVDDFGTVMRLLAPNSRQV